MALLPAYKSLHLSVVFSCLSIVELLNNTTTQDYLNIPGIPGYVVRQDPWAPLTQDYSGHPRYHWILSVPGSMGSLHQGLLGTRYPRILCIPASMRSPHDHPGLLRPSQVFQDPWTRPSPRTTWDSPGTPLRTYQDY